MPSRKGMNQAVVWLRSKMAEKDTLDAINAEICYNVLMDLQKKRKVIGALYHREYVAGKLRREEDEEIQIQSRIPIGFHEVQVDLPEEWK